MQPKSPRKVAETCAFCGFELPYTDTFLRWWYRPRIPCVTGLGASCLRKTLPLSLANCRSSLGMASNRVLVALVPCLSFHKFHIIRDSFRCSPVSSLLLDNWKVRKSTSRVCCRTDTKFCVDSLSCLGIRDITDQKRTETQPALKTRIHTSHGKEHCF